MWYKKPTKLAISSHLQTFELLVRYKIFPFKVCQGINLHSQGQRTQKQDMFTQNKENRKKSDSWTLHKNAGKNPQLPI